VSVQGHNRWHPHLEPVAVVSAGEEVTLEAPLGTGDQIGRESVHDDLLTLDFSTDLLAGPVYVEGAEPGDVLAVEVLEVEPDDFGFSAILPGFGFLSDVIAGPYLVKWELDGGVARSDELPGVAIPADPFPGTIGVAPSRELMERVHRREEELAQRIGLDLSELSPPPVPPAAADGLGTLPPREIGGNLDVRYLGRGSRLLLPVHVPGALLSLGDVHFAQGEGEVCGTAIEIGARVTFRAEVASSPAWVPRFPAIETAPQRERRYLATTGIPLGDDGRNELLDLSLATRRALLELIDYLVAAYGFAREAAYVLASVAAELRVSQVVDLPNALVSALLPLDVFERYRSPA
jgi:formamidase